MPDTALSEGFLEENPTEDEKAEAKRGK